MAALLPAEAMAHGFAGDRFFPATILTDDPFVANEISLPTVTLNPTQDDGSRELGVGPDLSMRITPDLGFHDRQRMAAHSFARLTHRYRLEWA